MSGEINVEANGLFGADETVVLTRNRLNQLVSGLVLRLAENAITQREIADGSIPATKLDPDIALQIGVPDDSISTAKLIDAVVTWAKLADNAKPQAGQAVAATMQTLTAGAATADVADLAVTITPRSVNSRFLLVAKLNITGTGIIAPFSINCGTITDSIYHFIL